jgi:hypothetical protein
MHFWIMVTILRYVSTMSLTIINTSQPRSIPFMFW